jgi:3'-5' exoribonuclease
MTRQYLTKLSDGEAVEEIYLASEKQLRPNRTGNLYLQLRCSDKSGSLTAMLWNADQRVYDSFENGNYVHVKGTAQLYNNNMQLILKSVQPVPASTINPEDFQTKSSQDIDRLLGQVSEQLRGMKNSDLRNLAEAFLNDARLMDCLKRAPAGVKNHHAYSGGLLEHVASLMNAILAIAPLYPEADSDLLLLGGFLHDIGKLEELSYSPDLGYTDAGQLLGHLVIGVQILSQKIAEVESRTGKPFPQSLALRLNHMIVSHHGEPEFGSPKVPMTFEALILHFLDNLDAKVASFRQLIADDVTPQSPWTTYNPQLGRKIYKGPAQQA